MEERSTRSLFVSALLSSGGDAPPALATSGEGERLRMAGGSGKERRRLEEDDDEDDEDDDDDDEEDEEDDSDKDDGSGSTTTGLTSRGVGVRRTAAEVVPFGMNCC